MKIRLISLLTLLLLVDLASASFAADRRLVLIANSQSSLANLPLADVRKLYLGMPMQQNGTTIKPIRNGSDTVAQEIFLQKVLFMSERVYERQVLSRVFRMGGNRPDVLINQTQLLSAVRSDPGAITYIWEDAISNPSGVKVIGVLWQGDL